MSPQSVWQRIVSTSPAGKFGFVIECLACGHPGKRMEPAQAEQRIEQGRTRLCKLCTKAAIAESNRQACAAKRVYLSKASALAESRYWPGMLVPYRCRVCGHWHLTPQQ